MNNEATPTPAAPELQDQPLSSHQMGQMALTLACFFCQEKGLPLLSGEGKPSQQVAAVAAALLS